MNPSFLGVLCWVSAAGIAIGGAFVSKRYFRDKGPAIGAIDMLFSWRGLLRLLVYIVFHLLWIGSSFSLALLGLAYLI